MAVIEVFAPAKINLTLHVTGRRADGYHLLDSLVAFATVGDWLKLAPATEFALAVDGPMAAHVPDGPSNLVWQAAKLMSDDLGAHVTIDKHLPAQAGIGGGSADAAAALRALSSQWNVAIPDDLTTLGADVPVCMRSEPTRMRGIGEDLLFCPEVPSIAAVLINPGVSVPTGPVFQNLHAVDNAPMEDPFPIWADEAVFLSWLARQRNDLEAPARALAPEIGDVLTTLSDAPGCRLSRMSGSGATCFGLFPSDENASAAAQQISANHKQWWVRSCRIGAVACRPQVRPEP